MKRRSELPGDDGHSVANMNVEGMPWHTGQSAPTDDNPREFPLDRRETRAFIWGALGAALLIAMVFIAGAAAFILFCTRVWFK